LHESCYQLSNCRCPIDLLFGFSKIHKCACGCGHRVAFPRRCAAECPGKARFVRAWGNDSALIRIHFKAILSEI
jgi:hypothetical protein